MRASILLTIISLVGVGCSANSHQSPVIGTWVLNPARHALPEQAKELRKTWDGWITVSGDGTYHSWGRCQDRTSGESGTWRLIGSTLYLHPIDRDWPDEPEETLGLQGNDLVAGLMPGVAFIYERRVK